MKNFLKIVLPVCFIMFSCSMETGKKQQKFKNVAEILSRSTWTETKNNIGSLALDFWHEHDGDTVALCYSMECILFYPYKLDDDKIIVYWDTIVDSKYHFDIVKAIGKIDKERVGKPFMILELENDTTLKAGYPMHDVREILNRSSDGRVFFPDTFKLTSIEGALDALY